MENKNIKFAISKISTDQFAIIEKSFLKGDEVKLNFGLQFGVNNEAKSVRVQIFFEFAQKTTPFILVKATCYFNIEPNDWEHLMPDNTSILLPKSLATHLTVLTVGTIRGILHAKTEGTNFNGFIIPTINVTKLVTDDVRIITE